MALHLPINGECNIQCVFCSAAGRNGGFGIGDLCRQVDADETGHVQISGGDPLLKEPSELLEILLHCRKKRKIIEFQTNAVLATVYDPKRFRLIAQLVDFFNVNFSAHTPELDFAVTLVHDGFQRRIDGVRLMAELGARVRLTYIVHSLNFRHAPDFVDFVRRELPCVEWLQFSYVKGMGRAKGNRDIIPPFAEAAAPLNEAMSRCRRLGLRFDIDHIPVCFVMDFKEQHVDYRKMREQKPGVYVSEKQKVAECDGCNIRAMCPGPRKDYIEVYGGI